jgi:hypothetical protein
VRRLWALPRAHLVRSAGCLAPPSTLRAAIMPTPRQQGVDGEESQTGTPYWHWARLLGRVFALAMATCPCCRRGSLCIIAAITQESVLTRLLRHLKLASVPPPIALARCRPELFAFDEAHPSVAHRRRARRGRVLRPLAPVQSRLTSSPPCAPETDEASASPILSGLSSALSRARPSCEAWG